MKISGVAIRPLDDALGYLEGEAAKILPQNYRIDYTGESRQLRTEGNKFLPAFLLAVVLIFLALAAQFNSFRDPFVILAGSVPLGMFGALVLVFLKMPNPNLPAFTDGWTTTLNVYSQVGLVTLVGAFVSEERILIVEFAEQAAGAGALEARGSPAPRSLASGRSATSVATVFGHFPLTLVTGPGAECARNSIGLVLVAGMTVGTAFTLFFVPAIYLLIARDHRAEDSASPRRSTSLAGARAGAGEGPRMSEASRPLPLRAAAAPRRAAGGQRSREPPHALAQLALGEPGEPHAERGGRGRPSNAKALAGWNAALCSSPAAAQRGRRRCRGGRHHSAMPPPGTVKSSASPSFLAERLGENVAVAARRRHAACARRAAAPRRPPGARRRRAPARSPWPSTKRRCSARQLTTSAGAAT